MMVTLAIICSQLVDLNLGIIILFLFCIHQSDAVDVPNLSERVDNTPLSKFL